MSETVSGRDATRTRIVEVAARLLEESGPAAVTTRAVAAEAGVQAPTLYRLFGDKDGLMEAVAEHVMAAYVRAKAEHERASSEAGSDPLEDLRTSWEAQVAFGLANPALFRLLSDPARVVGSPAAQAGLRVLEARVHRLAATGRLRVGEPHAVALVQAAGQGTIQVLLTTPPAQRDPALADRMLAAVLDQVLSPVAAPATDRPGSSAIAPAVALRALAPQLDVLTESERGLLAEWLDRVVEAGG
ncbi:TetR/AcrR family transcriptional regulator [Microlunatus flavus]|uniref:DNA-binding transcriptional regulator, AcrR family n=1 Tax=Microlunatus flavus TaxID=1036181 RepID=A0A1H9NWH8_9ACTN|nr:TetR/AcrR family transcriptional regulator [Microlunatus flavus]SER39693.1 DNA-binding transcriptional regulator, AcrR family [Microlunatus flavus]